MRFNVRSIIPIKRSSLQLGRLGVALAACFTIANALPTAAHASAYGYEYWGGFTIDVRGVPIGIPAGQLFGAVEGKGLRVDRAGGDFLTYTRSICNWHIDVDFLDRNGKLSRRIQGSDHYSCNNVGVEKYAVNQTVPEGRACIRLYTNFRYHVASVCHSIVR